ncbi:DUF397 domain-containing protein [Allosalinactinospora lopnorensis]|uniref:DUF397 domain-containing protein n=1 Tax=Allosalinactinospora lopnorensis TaxID=1352348 RepID=UPI0009E44AF5|nr:DUF397 domain-containing protein [Allosalinactinospora lopnorensis]
MAEWHKSSYSGATNECVEVREHAESVDMRDTRNRRLGSLSFTAAAWSSFLEAVKTGRL